jgi:hypothetical protein
MLAHRDGGGLGVRGAAGLLLADQAVEGIVKLLVLGLAIGVGPVPPALRRTAVLLAGTIAVAALLAGLLWRYGRWSARWVARWGSRIAPLGARPVQPSARIRQPGAALGSALLLAIASKAAEAAAIACVWRAYDAPLPWAALPAALGTTLVAGMLPITPANVGPYEAATSMLYQWLGMAKTPALVLTLVQHAAFLVPTVGGGALLLLAGGPLKPATTAASDAPQRQSAAAAWGILLATFAAYALVPAVHEALAQGPVRFRDDLVQRWELALCASCSSWPTSPITRWWSCRWHGCGIGNGTTPFGARMPRSSPPSSPATRSTCSCRCGGRATCGPHPPRPTADRWRPSSRASSPAAPRRARHSPPSTRGSP